MVTHKFESVLKHFARKKQIGNLWKYATGLRGNDDMTPMFKEIVITVIRGEVDYAYAFNEPSALSILNKYENNPKQTTNQLEARLTKVSLHAVHHAATALRSLAEYHVNKRHYKFADELRLFARAVDHKDTVNILKSWKILHEMWG